MPREAKRELGSVKLRLAVGELNCSRNAIHFNAPKNFKNIWNRD